MTREKQIALCKKLRAEGKNWTDIAHALRAEGAITSRGQAPSAGYAWGLLPENIDKIAKAKRDRANASGGGKKGKKSALVVAESVGTIDKYEVLRAIENCRDFKASTKRALTQLVMQEVFGG